MTDFCLSSDSVVLDANTDLVMQQIDMLFDTSPRELLGEPIYGSDYEKFLWDMTASGGMISSYIDNNIRNNVDLLGHNLSVQAEVLMGTVNDIILVDINITTPEGAIFGKTYNIR